MAFTITTPATDWTILKYVRGAPDAWYIIKKEALTHAKNNYTSATIYRWLDGNTYQHKFKADNSDIKLYAWSELPPDIKELLNQQNSMLFDQFRPNTKKSEPTPDDYYLVKYEMPTWYIAKRAEYDNPTKVSSVTQLLEVPAMFWTSKDDKWPANVGTNSAAGNPHKKYKFPQLSSEIKQELRKLNPERYKEWEDFYVAKYPNFKRLEETPAWVEPKEYNLENIVILSSREDVQPKNWKNDHANGWCFLDKTYYNSLKAGDSFVSAMWSDPKQFTKPTVKGGPSVMSIPPRSFNPELYDRVMSQQTQCGCGTCTDCLNRLPLPDPKDDYVFIGNCGWALIKRADLHRDAASVFDTVTGWRLGKMPWNHPTEYKNMDSNAWRSMSDKICKWQLIADTFEQYYEEKEAKSILNKTSYPMTGKTPDMFYLYTVGRGWELARREAINGVSQKPSARDTVQLISIKDYSIREVAHEYITQFNGHLFVNLQGEGKENFRKQNPILFGQWTHEVIDSKIRGKEADMIFFEEAAKFPKDAVDWYKIYNKDLIKEMVDYAVGIDPVCKPGYLDHDSGVWVETEPEWFCVDSKPEEVLQYNNNQPKYSPNLKTSNMNFKQLLPNFEFGKVTTDKLALSFSGVAFKAQDGSYKTFDLKTKQLIDCGDLKFDVDFFKMPVPKLKAGDVTELDGAYYIVEKVNEDGSFTGIVPTTGTRSNKLARNNIFGFYFYTKIVSLFDMAGLNGDNGGGNNPFGQMNPMMLMMLSDKDGSKSGGMEGMMEIMLMSQMFAGGGQGFNPFGFAQPQAAPVREPGVAKPAAKKSKAKTPAGKARAQAQGLDIKE